MALAVGGRPTKWCEHLSLIFPIIPKDIILLYGYRGLVIRYDQASFIEVDVMTLWMDDEIPGYIYLW